MDENENFQIEAIEALKGNEVCPFCEMLEPNDGHSSLKENQYIDLPSSRSCWIRVMLDEHKKLYFAADDSWSISEPYYPKFCPNCGRNLQS